MRTPDVTAANLTYPSRWSRLALAIGGLLFILMYAQQMVFAVQTGRLPGLEEVSTSLLARLNAVTFTGALFAVGAGLAGIGAALRVRAPLDQIYQVAAGALVGGIVAARRQTSPIGWLLLTGALCYRGRSRAASFRAGQRQRRAAGGRAGRGAFRAAARPRAARRQSPAVRPARRAVSGAGGVAPRLGSGQGVTQ